MIPTNIPRFLPLFAVALAVRAGTVALGVWLASLPPDPYTDPNTPTLFHDEFRARSAQVIEPWYRFDAMWMANVARNGYAGAHDASGRLGVAFFPALPASMAAAEAVGVNLFWAGLVIANLAGAAGAAVFTRVAARELNDAAAGWRALAVLLAFPTAFFFSAPYNESFGLLFTALALAAWQRNQPARAGLFALGGSLARMTGGALAVAAAADWLLTRDRKHLARTLAVVAGSLGGIALAWGVLWWAVGDPLAGLKVQEKWGRAPLSWKNPFRTLESVYDPALPHWGEAVAVAGFIILGVRSWKKRGTFWGMLTLVPVAQMFASGTLLSAHRIVLASLPAFVELADLLRVRRLALAAVLLGFVFAQLVLLNHFVHWRFAG